MHVLHRPMHPCTPRLLDDDGALNDALHIEHSIITMNGKAVAGAKSVTAEAGSVHQIRFVRERPTSDEVVCAITIRDHDVVIEQARSLLTVETVVEGRCNGVIIERARRVPGSPSHTRRNMMPNHASA